MESAKNAPGILAQMIRACWLDIGKQSLSIQQLEEDLDCIKRYFFNALPPLGKGDLLDLCLDYLRISGYKVTYTEDIGGLRCAKLLRICPDMPEPHGLAVFAFAEGPDKRPDLSQVLSLQSKYGFFIVFTPGIAKIGNMQPRINVITVGQDELFKTFAGIILQEYLNPHLYAIALMPNFKEAMPKIIEEKTGLTWNDLAKLRAAWVMMIGKY